MENNKPKNREWVKTAAIIFLSVLLVLTFFSNTWMNRTLPEVSTVYVERGGISPKIRGTGTVVRIRKTICSSFSEEPCIFSWLPKS